MNQQLQIPKNWKNEKLGNISDICRGGSPRPIAEYLTKDTDGINWLRIGDINVNSKYIYKTSEKIKKEGLNKTTLVKEGDFILSNSMSFGRPYIMKTKSCIHDGWLALRNIKDNINQDFLYYLLLTEKSQYLLKTLAAGSGVQNLKKETVSTVELSFPPLLEQNRIVEILETWDKYLERLDQKIKIKKNIKKGLVQSLLKKNKLNWNSKKLKEVVVFNNGKGHERDIVDDGKYVVVNSKYISSDQKVIKYSNKQLSPLFIGEVTMVMSDVPKGKAIAKCFLIDKDNTYTLNQRIGSFSSKDVISHFLFYLLNRNRYFLSFDDGVNQTNLRKEDILNCPIQYPPKDEQNKIVKFLITADKEIETLEKQREIVKNQKKYLLNNLITGQIRLPEFINKNQNYDGKN